MDRMPADLPATLAAWLRTRSDEQLGALLATRPDVARPAPSDVVALATRLAVPVSVDRALDELDAATLQVLDAVLLSPTDGVARVDLPGLLPDVPAGVVADAVETLTTRALLWGDAELHAPDQVRRSVRYPAGLGRRGVDLRVPLPRDLPAALDALDAGGRIVVMAYQSLEDRIVKTRFAEATASRTPPGLPVELPGHGPEFVALTRGAERAAPEEIERNPRSAPVRLRALEKVAGREVA